MYSGDGDDTWRGAANPKARLYRARLAKVFAVLGAVAAIHCSDDDDDLSGHDDGAGQSSVPGGSGGAGAGGGSFGGKAIGGATQMGNGGSSGNESRAGESGSSGKASNGGSSGKNGAGAGGVENAGRGGAGNAGLAGGGSGGTTSAGRGGRGGTAGASAGKGGAAAGSAGTAGSGGSEQAGAFAGALEAHNAVRAMVNMGDPLPPLTWSDALAVVAQDWADELAGECDSIHHRMPNQYGENIAAQWSSGISNPDPYGPQAVAAWADEIECWGYGTINGTEQCDQQCVEMQNSSGCGHYTQLVWRKTKQVGCGYATCTPEPRTLMEIFVCNYDPPGNYIGQLPY